MSNPTNTISPSEPSPPSSATGTGTATTPPPAGKKPTWNPSPSPPKIPELLPSPTPTTNGIILPGAQANPTPSSTAQEELRARIRSKMKPVNATPFVGAAPDKSPDRVKNLFNLKRMMDALPVHVEDPVNTSEFVVPGTNIGQTEGEPEWDDEQRQIIASRMRTRLEVVKVHDTRRAVVDPHGKYVLARADGTVAPTEEIYLTNMGTKGYDLGVGKWSYDPTYGPKVYMDLVMLNSTQGWMFTQFVGALVILEGTPPTVINRTPKESSGKRSRTVGVHFARVGLPKLGFAPPIETIAAKFSGIKERTSISETTGYYWLNSSWGVSNSPGKFAYLDRDSTTGKSVMTTTTSLKEGMLRLDGKSSIGIGTFAISICAPAVRDARNQMTAAGAGQTLSFKLHSYVHLKTTEIHGPSQQNSSTMVITAKMLEEAEILMPPAMKAPPTNWTNDLFEVGYGLAPMDSGSNQGVGGEVNSMSSKSGFLL